MPESYLGIYRANSQPGNRFSLPFGSNLSPWVTDFSAFDAANGLMMLWNDVRLCCTAWVVVAYCSGFLLSSQSVFAQTEKSDAIGISAAVDQSDPKMVASVAALQPLFDQIRKAKSTRVTVELSADTVVDGAVINTVKSVYQIASKTPGSFTIYLKDDTRRTRLFCNEKASTIAFSPTAYTHLKKPIAMQEAVYQLPIPMGPYPEAVLSLSLAGVDPGLTLTTGVKLVSLADRKPFRGKIPATHFVGLQDDDVRWDLWVTQAKQPAPLRLKVDLTDMLRANGSLKMPVGYRYILQFDFSTWKINPTTTPNLFRHTQVEDSTEYESIEAYFQELSEQQRTTKP